MRLLGCCRPKRQMKPLYEDGESQELQRPGSQPVSDSEDDADLDVQPFGSRTQSDHPEQGDVPFHDAFYMKAMSCCLAA